LRAGPAQLKIIAAKFSTIGVQYVPLESGLEITIGVSIPSDLPPYLENRSGKNT